MRRVILLLFIQLIAYGKAEEEQIIQADPLSQNDQLYYPHDASWYQRVAHPSHKIPKPQPQPIVIRTWMIQEPITLPPQPIPPVQATEATSPLPPPKREPVPIPVQPSSPRPPISRPPISRPAWVRPVPTTTPATTTTTTTTTQMAVIETTTASQPKYVPNLEPENPQPQPEPQPQPPLLQPKPQPPHTYLPSRPIPQPIPRPRPYPLPPKTTPRPQIKEVPTEPPPPPPTAAPPPPPPVTRPPPPPVKPQPPYKPPVTSPRPSYITTKWSNNDLPAKAEYLSGYSCKQYNGYEIYANECESYVECKNNRAIKYVCPDGLYFNPKIVWPEYPCSYPTEVQCDGRMLKQAPRPTSECPRQYGYFPSGGSDCSTYIMCQEGMATPMNCPPGLVFNPTTASCDWPVNVPNCKPAIFQGFSCPAAPLDEYGQPSDVIRKFRYGKSCKEYIACQQGHPRLLSCDAGLSFDESSESCVDSDYVKNCEERYTPYL